MRIEQLRYLVAIADCGTITAAAKRLFVAQPSLSQAVALLEEELGFAVFQRSRGGSVPTASGKLVIEHARKVLEEINAIKNLADWTENELNATIAVGSVPSICTLLLPKVVAKYKKAYPNVKVKIIENGSAKTLAGLKSDALDIGVITMSAEDAEKEKSSGLLFLPLIKSELMAYVRYDNPLAAKEEVSYADIIEYPLILYSEEYELYRVITRGLSQCGIPANVLTSTKNPASIKQFILATDAIGFGPILSWKEDIYVTQGRIVPLRIKEQWISTFGIAFFKGKGMSKAAKAFKEVLECEMLALAQ